MNDQTAGVMDEETEPVSVAVVDDQDLIRVGLRTPEHVVFTHHAAGPAARTLASRVVVTEPTDGSEDDLARLRALAGP